MLRPTYAALGSQVPEQLFLHSAGLNEQATVNRLIDGRTEEVTRIKAGTELAAIALNAATNEIYVYDPEKVTVIDGATNKLTNILLPIPSKMPRYSNRCGSTLLLKSSHSRTFEGFWRGPD